MIKKRDTATTTPPVLSPTPPSTAAPDDGGRLARRPRTSSSAAAAESGDRERGLDGGRAAPVRREERAPPLHAGNRRRLSILKAHGPSSRQLKWGGSIHLSELKFCVEFSFELTQNH